MTDLITDEGVGFIQRKAGKPFFLYVAYTAPHTPYQGPGDEKPEPVAENDYNKGSRETYATMVEQMDQGVGRILKTLDDAGLADNTLVIFMSDNGANRTGNNSPFSGYKGNLFEGGIRVPCIVKWPGVLARGAVSDQPCMTMDFSRSIVRAAGTEPPAGRAFDGMDILRAAATNRPVEQRTLFWRARRAQQTRKAVRDGSLKYIHLQDGDDVKEYLFDLERDPAEKNNILNKQPESVLRLKNLLKNWEQQVKHNR